MEISGSASHRMCQEGKCDGITSTWVQLSKWFETHELMEAIPPALCPPEADVDLCALDLDSYDVVNAANVKTMFPTPHEFIFSRNSVPSKPTFSLEGVEVKKGWSSKEEGKIEGVKVRYTRVHTTYIAAFIHAIGSC